MNVGQGRVLVLASIGFDDNKPYLLINDVQAKTQEQFLPVGKTLSIKKKKRRFCIGYFDLEARTRGACQLSVELPTDSRDDMCPTCRDITGFNPAFYNTVSISPQQRAYNNTPHFVYLAYFSPQHVKAGISSDMRGIRRLLEQGARAAMIVGRFPTAEDARDLEARLCAREGIFETMRAAKKAELLVGHRYDFAEAQQVLQSVAQEAGLDGFEECLDLDPYSFEGGTPSIDDLQLPHDGSEGICGGRCVGMVGPLMVLEQEGIDYVVSLKEWESFEIELYEDEVIHHYDFEPMQMSLL